MKLNLELGQHILVNKDVLNRIIELANLNKKDCVLEIGAGEGVLTEELAKKANCVLAFEIDMNFKQGLDGTLKKYKNVIVLWQDIINFLKKSEHLKKHQLFRKHILNKLIFKVDKKDVRLNKIVANLPYHLCEPLLLALFYLYDFESAVLLVPQSFAKYLMEYPVAKAMLDVTLDEVVPKNCFEPKPRTISQIILVKQRKYNFDSDKGDYFIRCLYQLESMKLKNALRECLIELYRCIGKKLTKRDSREIIAELGLSKRELEASVHELDVKEYGEIVNKLMVGV